MLAELLLQAGANIDAVDVMRRSPIMWAVLYDRPEVARLLLRCVFASATVAAQHVGAAAAAFEWLVCVWRGGQAWFKHSKRHIMRPGVGQEEANCKVFLQGHAVLACLRPPRLRASPSPSWPSLFIAGAVQLAPETGKASRPHSWQQEGHAAGMQSC